MPDTVSFVNICAPSRGFNIFKQSAWGKPHAYRRVEAPIAASRPAAKRHNIREIVAHCRGKVGSGTV